MTLTRTVRFYPHEDLRKRGLGMGAVKIVFILGDGTRAVTLTVSTGWYPDGTTVAPMGFGVDVHSPTPREGWYGRSQCDHTGGPCWGSGSGVDAERMLDVLRSEGDGAVWAELETWWRSEFEREAAE
jgi:hypothetical protein